MKDDLKVPYETLNAQWPNIQFHNEGPFIVSSKQSKGIKELTQALTSCCNQILDAHSKRIPKSYREVLRVVKNMSRSCFASNKRELLREILKKDVALAEVLEGALRYLHNIGQIVKFQDFICLEPPKIPQIMAKFISPKEVRDKLMTKDSTKVEILSEYMIKCVLYEAGGSKSLEEELEVMCRLKVCFHLVSASKDDKLYLFPSLATKGQLMFPDVPQQKQEDRSQPTEVMSYAGVRFCAPRHRIFVDGMFCKLMVEILSALKIHRDDLFVAHSNGIIIKCQGMVGGSFIVQLAEDFESIDIVIQARSPNLKVCIGVFRSLIEKDFPKCIQMS